MAPASPFRAPSRVDNASVLNDDWSFSFRYACLPVDEMRQF